MKWFYCGVLALCLMPSSWAQTTKTTGVQRLAIPSYIYPDDAACATAGQPTPLSCPWKRALERSAVDILIINPASGPGMPAEAGPGTGTHADYSRQIAQAHKYGRKVLAYVPTNYANAGGKVPLSTAKLLVSRYYSWYKDVAHGVWIDGIFLDEASSLTGTISPYYLPLYNHIKSRTSKPVPLVALNPGTHVAEAFLKVGDLIVTFESPYAEYKKYIQENPLSTLGWEAKAANAKRIWHIVYNVDCPNYATDSQSVCPKLKQTINWAKKRNAGYLYVSSDKLPNPYDSIPGRAYWRDENAYAASPTLIP